MCFGLSCAADGGAYLYRIAFSLSGLWYRTAVLTVLTAKRSSLISFACTHSNGPLPLCVLVSHTQAGRIPVWYKNTTNFWLYSTLPQLSTVENHCSILQTFGLAPLDRSVERSTAVLASPAPAAGSCYGRSRSRQLVAKIQGEKTLL